MILDHKTSLPKNFQIKSLAMHITYQKWSFDIFMVGNLQNIFMEHDLYYILNVCVLVYICYVYINTHTGMYIFQKYMLCLYNVYILNICIYNVNYMNIIYTCMCVHSYLHNKYTQYSHIYVNKNFQNFKIFWKWFIIWQHLFIYILSLYSYTCNYIYILIFMYLHVSLCILNPEYEQL